MNAEFDLKSAMGIIDETLPDAPEETSRLNQLWSGLTEMRVTTLLRLYRFASLALSSLLFLLYPGNFHLYTQLSLIFLLLSTAVLLIFLYEHFRENNLVTSILLIIEALGISFLLTFTGGFNGPFLWYALNPFIVASTLLTFLLAWLLLGAIFAGALVFHSYFVISESIHADLFISSFHPALNLMVIAFIIQLYSRVHLKISERNLERSSQQRELISAQESLSANYQVFKGLSLFQKEVVSYNSRKDIYTTLIDSLINIFPFKEAAVLTLPPGFQPRSNPDSIAFDIISSNEGKVSSTIPFIQIELKRRWTELSGLSAKKILISEDRQWIALPMRGENKAVTAVFVGWIKPRINPLSFSGNLSLFIRFAEQTTEWLSMFKQKERVLQHISAVYEAVETVSSQNDPRVVIDLFASYARALTDSEKTMFWMESTGNEDSDGNYTPIYAVKGPRDTHPEEEWHETLLEVWSEIRFNKEPIAKELNTQEGHKNFLISVPVKKGPHCFGMLSCIQSNTTFSTKEIIQILSVLAELGSIAVVRSEAEKFAEKLLVFDEQKRIANEIHDSISQNLFSIVYSIDALSRETDHLLDSIHQETFKDIKTLSAETSRELRSLIYRLNPQQEANETFIKQVCDYLDTLARMNEIKIKHTINGSAIHLNPAICKTLYRIIKESTGNALRHGNCSEILVYLDITPFHSELKVSDNGRGFDMQNSLNVYTSGNRLGIVNMRELALSLQGTLNIDSKPGVGTEVTCAIPTSLVSVE